MALLAVGSGLSSSTFRLDCDINDHPFDNTSDYSMFFWKWNDYADGSDMPGNAFLWRTSSAGGTNGVINLSQQGDDDIVAIAYGTPNLIAFASWANSSNYVRTWTLYGISFDASAGSLTIFAENENEYLTHTATNGAYATGTIQFWQIGDATSNSLRGAHGLTVVRDHVITADDFRGVYAAGASGDYFAPYRMTLNGSAGPANTIFMANYMTSSHNTADGAEFSDDISTGDYYSINTQATPSTSFYSVQNYINSITSSDEAQYYSPYRPNELWSGFFTKQGSDLDLGHAIPYTSGVAPKNRRLAYNTPSGRETVVAWANSRGVRSDQRQNIVTGEQQNHCWGGLFFARKAKCAGTFLYPPKTAGGSSPFFRPYPNSSTNPPQATGDLRQTSTDGNDITNFGRFATFGNPVGESLFMGEDAVYSCKSRPEETTLFDGTDGDGTNADFPCKVTYTLLRFPGAGSASYRTEISTAQINGTSDYGSSSSTDLDSTDTFSRTGGASDTYAVGSVVFDSVDLTSNITAGMGMYVESGTGAEGFTLVTSVTFGSGDTTVTFQKDLNTAPANGSVMKFGTVDLVDIEQEFAAQGVSDTKIFRGLEITATGGPIVLLSMKCERTDVDGWIIGPGGWSGKGYAPQLDTHFFQNTEGNPHWAAHYQPDIVHLWIANQSSVPGDMFRFAKTIADESATSEIVLCGDMEHDGTLHAWHTTILDNAKASGYLGVSVINASGTGNEYEQAVDNMKSDQNHPGERGYHASYTNTFEFLQSGALPSLGRSNTTLPSMASLPSMGRRR